MKALLFTQCAWVICLFLGVVFKSGMMLILMVLFVFASLAICIHAAFEGQDDGRQNN